MAECPENPGCREDLLKEIRNTEKKLNCTASKHINRRSFVSGCVIVVAIISAVISIAYLSYAGRMERMEASQVKQDAKVEEQGKAINRIDKTVEKIKVRQETVIEKLNDMNGMLKSLINDKVNSYHPKPAGD